MKLEIDKTDDRAVVRFEGNLDTTTAPDADGALADLAEGGARRIVCDFTDLDFITSAGLQTLISAAMRLKKSHGTLCVCALNDTVREVFAITGLSAVLHVYTTRDEALSAS